MKRGKGHGKSGNEGGLRKKLERGKDTVKKEVVKRKLQKGEVCM